VRARCREWRSAGLAYHRYIHELYRVTKVTIVGEYRLTVAFDDGLTRIIDLEPVLAGALYGPLRDPALFRQVTIDPEVHTLVWPSGADFDPETLHNWPRYEAGLIERARHWHNPRPRPGPGLPLSTPVERGLG
jgi:hypothetical protein